MKLLSNLLFELPEVSELASAFQADRLPAEISGLSHVHKAHLFASLSERLGRPMALICPDEQSAQRLSGDIGALTNKPVSLLPGRDLILSGVDTFSREWELARIAALYDFVSGASQVLITSVQAALCRPIPRDTLIQSVFTLAPGQALPLDSAVDGLIHAGYQKSASTEGPGQFSVRGGILDVFSPAQPFPVRVEYFGDEVDTLSFFDPESQRRTGRTDQLTLLPVREVLPVFARGGLSGLIKKLETQKIQADKKALDILSKNLSADLEALRETGSITCPDRLIPLIFDRNDSFSNYLSDAVVFFSDLPRIREAANAFSWRMGEDITALIDEQRLPSGQTAYFEDWETFFAHMPKERSVLLNTFSAQESGVRVKTLTQIAAKQLPSYGGNLDVALSDIRYYIEAGFRVLLLCSGEHRCRNMLKILEEADIRAVYSPEPAELPPDTVVITCGSLSAGLEYPAIRLAVITEGQLTDAPVRRRKRRRKEGERIRNYSDLKPGDIIVHDLHGLGRFTGIEKMVMDGHTRDYIRLAFQGTDTLYVPAVSLDVISKYIGGGEDQAVRLSKLGGTDWQKQKLRAGAAAKDMAKQLIALYAERQRRPGVAFLPDDDNQQAFEEAFEYEETEDQLRCTFEIKKDMVRSVPMDRLLCGDVGFGKTEVAFRAVMKCVLSGKQAALLVPTTVLARQHYLTAHSRFSGTAVKVDMISRFKSTAEQKKTLARAKSGRIDLLIGTHRILQKDVCFHDLGLLIVDEEQRFGVSHKERIKEMAKNIDVLTLTATPIPRTLSMALSGIRDMSVLEEAPHDRRPITTYVLEYDTGILYDAIGRELARGGQVYYLHNRTESIDRCAARIAAAFPDAAVGVAHGKMDEEQLSDVMQQLSDGDIQILVCTTIIETGIDVPNVNTLIVENAENFGLAQLHQIRGRVGRSARRAFAYFTYRPGKALSEISQKRLSAIREFTEFGSGFKIAMRDLEIRGAGNVLGAEQSGHMVKVGYDLYLRLLEEAVLTEQGKALKQKCHCTAEFSVSAYIPDAYVPDSGDRVDLYRRIAMIRDEEDHSDMLDEMLDRYGDMPESVISLLAVALLRAKASEAGLAELSEKQNTLIVRPAVFDLAAVSALCALEKYRGRLLLSAGSEPYLSLRLKKGEDVLKTADTLVSDYLDKKYTDPA